MPHPPTAHPFGSSSINLRPLVGESNSHVIRRLDEVLTVDVTVSALRPAGKQQHGERRHGDPSGEHDGGRDDMHGGQGLLQPRQLHLLLHGKRAAGASHPRSTQTFKVIVR
eukprot:992782-Prorocentrum_minimum.AAC.2